MTAGMKPEKTTELIKSIIAEIDKIERHEPVWIPFPEMYDLKTIQPKPELRDQLLRSKDVLARLGVPYH